MSRRKKKYKAGHGWEKWQEVGHHFGESQIYTGIEQRQGKRLTRNIPLIYKKLDEKGGLLCMANSETLDMGSRGCCLRLCHQLALNDVIEMEFWFDTGESEQMEGRIVWLEQEGTAETWRAGVKFTRSLSPGIAGL